MVKDNWYKTGHLEQGVNAIFQNSSLRLAEMKTTMNRLITYLNRALDEFDQNNGQLFFLTGLRVTLVLIATEGENYEDLLEEVNFLIFNQQI